MDALQKKQQQYSKSLSPPLANSYIMSMAEINGIQYLIGDSFDHHFRYPKISELIKRNVQMKILPVSM